MIRSSRCLDQLFVARSSIGIVFFVNSIYGGKESFKRYSTVITAGQKEYEISVNGTLQPKNLELILENIGDEIIINPKITINGKWDWRTVESIVNEIIKCSDAKTDEEKAMAIWEFVRDKRYHWQPPGDNIRDPIIYLNVYGYGFCGHTARIMDIFAKVAGLKSRYWALSGHLITEIFFNGKWHILDLSLIHI